MENEKKGMNSIKNKKEIYKGTIPAVSCFEHKPLFRQKASSSQTAGHRH